MKFVKYFLLLAIIPMVGFSPVPEAPAGKKAAVCTFYVSKYIDFSELDAKMGVAAAVAGLSDDPSFNLQPVLDKFHTKFFGTYAKAFPFEMLAEDAVTGNADYKAYESKFGETGDADQSKWMQRYLTAPGYKPLSESGLGKNRNNLAMREIFKDQAEGIMFVSMEFAFVKKVAVGGTGTCGIRASIRIKMWNEEDKKVFAINESAVSKSTVGLVGGIPTVSPEKLIPLCNEAADRLMADLEKRLPKIAAKAGKKF